MDLSHSCRPDPGFVPKDAVGWSMGIGLNSPRLEDKSNSGQEDKQLINLVDLALSRRKSQTMWSFDTSSSFILYSYTCTYFLILMKMPERKN